MSGFGVRGSFLRNFHRRNDPNAFRQKAIVASVPGVAYGAYNFGRYGLNQALHTLNRYFFGGGTSTQGTGQRRYTNSHWLLSHRRRMARKNRKFIKRKKFYRRF